jgi:hypothetical protein
MPAGSIRSPDFATGHRSDDPTACAQQMRRDTRNQFATSIRWIPHMIAKSPV